MYILQDIVQTFSIKKKKKKKKCNYSENIIFQPTVFKTEKKKILLHRVPSNMKMFKIVSAHHFFSVWASSACSVCFCLNMAFLHTFGLFVTLPCLSYTVWFEFSTWITATSPWERALFILGTFICRIAEQGVLAALQRKEPDSMSSVFKSNLHISSILKWNAENLLFKQNQNILTHHYHLV